MRHASLRLPSRSRSPFVAHRGVGLGASAAAASAAKSRPVQQPRQRPDRRAAHQRRRRRRASARHGRHSAGIAGIAGGDQHVAHEAVAADALDRRAGEERRGRRRRRARAGRRAPARADRRGRASFALARRRWRTCSTGRRPGSRRSHRCGCRSRRGTRAGSAPCARWSDRRCSAAHRAGRAPGKASVGQASRQARQEPQWSLSGRVGRRARRW